jgi:hypothetical protein
MRGCCFENSVFDDALEATAESPVGGNPERRLPTNDERRARMRSSGKFEAPGSVQIVTVEERDVLASCCREAHVPSGSSAASNGSSKAAEALIAWKSDRRGARVVDHDALEVAKCLFEKRIERLV